MSPNRVVAALTPLAALLAGAAAQWLARHFPGVEVPTAALEQVFVGGMAAVVAPSAVWLFGWQKHEAREASGADRFEAALQSHELALADLDDDEPEEDFDELDLGGADTLGEDEELGLDEEALSELALDDGDLDEPGIDEGLATDDVDLDLDEDDELLAELADPAAPSRVG